MSSEDVTGIENVSPEKAEVSTESGVVEKVRSTCL